MAKDEERKPKKEMGTEWKKMGGQCGKVGRERWGAGREGDSNGG